MDEDIEAKILKKVYAWIALAMVGMGTGLGVLGPVIIRDDPFTGSDGELLKQEIEFNCRQMEHEIRKDMPPICTRKRIINIEQFLEEIHPEFERSDFCW